MSRGDVSSPIEIRAPAADHTPAYDAIDERKLQAQVFDVLQQRRDGGARIAVMPGNSGFDFVSLNTGIRFGDRAHGGNLLFQSVFDQVLESGRIAV